MDINKSVFYYLYKTKPYAIARVQGGKDFPLIKGVVEFYALPKGVLVLANIENLPKTETNIFAFHIHEGNSCDDNFNLTGGHLNLKNAPHPNHSGDMPPLFSNNGKACMAFYTERVSMKDILSKVVVIHEKPDDFTSQPSGNSGNKIACGVIKKIK